MILGTVQEEFLKTTSVFWRKQLSVRNQQHTLQNKQRFTLVITVNLSYITKQWSKLYLERRLLATADPVQQFGPQESCPPLSAFLHIGKHQQQQHTNSIQNVMYIVVLLDTVSQICLFFFCSSLLRCHSSEEESRSRAERPSVSIT